jgi:cellulose synthase (UDP-forming)
METSYNPFLTVASGGLTWGVIVGAVLLGALPWLKRDGNGRIFPVVLVLIVTARYAWWRLTDTLPIHGTPIDLMTGILFLFVEVGSIVSGTIAYITLSRTSNRTPEVDAHLPALLARETHPLVDVFICTYNEEAAILERTIIGATGMSYPNYRVWILDDGRRPWLRDLTRELGCHYLDRPDNKGAKAGNINHALKHVGALPERPEFVSILDADFVPNADFLSRTMSLFHADDVGVVQTPQHFINQDPIQSNLRAADLWPDEQRFFFDIILPAKDAWGTAFCCGTSSVLRMSALDKLGGFPTDSVTEDYLVTMRMKRMGYRTVYLNERLSLGLAPEGLREYVTQRGRWCLGFMQILRGPDGPLKFGNGLTLTDRIGLIDSFLYWSIGYMFRIFCLMIPILYLVFGIQAVDASFEDGLSYFLPYYVAQVTVIWWISGGRVVPLLTDISQLLAAREILGSVFVGLFRPKGHKFVVTAKGGDRSKVIIQWKLIAIIAAILVLNIFGVVTTFLNNSALLESSAVALFWTWYNIAMLLTAIACCVEQPRYRLSERLPCVEPVEVHYNGKVKHTMSLDISIDGIRFSGRVSASIGSPVTLRFDGRTLAGTVIRKSGIDTAVQLNESTDMRTIMIRKVYSGSHVPAFQSIRPAKLATRIARRIME